jgi:hypothetical protein
LEELINNKEDCVKSWQLSSRRHTCQRVR